MLVIWCPVKNEARHIEETLRSVIGQTHQAWRMVVSDNHSDDGTDEIVQDYAAVDQRISLVRPREPLPGIQHAWSLWQHVRDGEPADAAMHIGGHDVLERQYLQKLSATLNANPGVVVAFPKLPLQIDDVGRVLGRYGSGPQTVGIENPWRWLSQLINVQHNHMSYGLVRWDAFRNVPLMHICSACDHFVNAELTLFGDLIEVDTFISLRKSPGHGDHDVYRKKHFGHLDPAEDVRRQVSWIVSLVDRTTTACDPDTKAAVLSTAVLTWLVRYQGMLDAMGVLQRVLSAECPELHGLVAANIEAGRRLQGVLV